VIYQARNQWGSERADDPPVCRQKVRFRRWKKVFEHAIKLNFRFVSLSLYCQILSKVPDLNRKWDLTSINRTQCWSYLFCYLWHCAFRLNGCPPSLNCLMFHFLKSSWRSLLLEARFLAWNSPNTVWRPGSAQTCWGSWSTPPDPLAAIRAHTSKGRRREGREGQWRGGEKGGKGRGGEWGEGRRDGKGGERGEDGKGSTI